MGEERIPTGFELARENARLMLERTSPSDPTTQAMGEVAESVNSMDQATRGLLGKITRRLEELANTASAASSEQAKALEQSAKDAAERFGEVYTTVGGVTAEDIEGLTESLSRVVAEGAPAGVEAEAARVRESAQEFASTIQEASSRFEEAARVAGATAEEQVDVLAEVRGLGEVPVGERVPVEAQQAQLELLRSIARSVAERAPTPREALETPEAAGRILTVRESLGIERRGRREEREEAAEEQKGLLWRLGGTIVGGFEKVYKAFLPDLMTQIGFLVGGVYAVKDELLLGLQVGWDVLKEEYNKTVSWWQENWRDVSGMFLDLAVDIGMRVKDGLVWLWGEMPAIKGWLKDALTVVVKGFVDIPRAIVEAVRTWWEGRETEKLMKESAELREAAVKAIPAGAPREMYGEARRFVGPETAMMFSGLAEQNPVAAAEALELYKGAVGRGVAPHIAGRQARELVRGRRAEAEARAAETPAAGVTVAAERDLQVRAATTAAEPTGGMAEVSGLMRRQLEMMWESMGRGEAKTEMPAFFDGVGPPDDLGGLTSAAGLAGGGIQ